MKKTLLMLSLVLLTGAAASASLELESSAEFYTAGDNLTFNFTGESANYTINFVTEEGPREIKSFEVESEVNQTNTTYNREISHELGEVLYDSYGRFELESEDAYTREVYLGGEDPHIEKITTSPEFIREGELVTVGVRGIDVGYEVESVLLEVMRNGTVDKTLMDSREKDEPFFSYGETIMAGEIGTRRFNVTVRANGTNVEKSSSFRVYPEDYAGDPTDISATVVGLCNVSESRSPGFAAPGEGVVSANSSGWFHVQMQTANSPVNMSYSINVSYAENRTDLDNETETEFVTNYTNSYFPPSNFSEGYRRPLLGRTTVATHKFNKTSRFGWYRGVLTVNATCHRPKTRSDEVYERNDDFNRTAYPQYPKRDVSGTDSPFFQRNFSVEFAVIRPGGGAGEGDPTDNTSVPERADQVGDESDQQVEGDNDAPGVTPEPVPDPVPEPVPEPTPILSVNIQEINDTYQLPRGGYSPVKLSLTNHGEQALQDLNIAPLVGNLGGGWEARNASIANLSADEQVNRTVFLRPPEEMETGRYSIPVLARDTLNDRELDLEYIDVQVNKANFSTEVEIAEVPETVQIQAGGKASIPLLVNNTGRKNISQVDLRVQNMEECGAASASGLQDLKVNSTGSASLELNASNSLTTCNTTVIVSTDSGAYTFSDLRVEITPEEGIVPPEFRVPLIAVLWTIGLMAYAVARRRLELDSMLVKGPFVIMVMGEVLIILYLAAQYYSIIPAGVLPF